MKLGFHYHIPAGVKENRIFVQGFFGVFLDSLAREVDELHLFLHRPLRNEWVLMDYALTSENVVLHDIGLHNSMPLRLLNKVSILKSIEEKVLCLDAFLVRAPSPLSPFFILKFGKKIPFSMLLVGNYATSDDDPSLPFWKNKIIRLFSYYIHFFQNKAAGRVKLFVNSKLLYDENVNRNPELNLVKTTTLSKASFYRKSEAELDWNVIKVLYTGRIDLSKGLLLICEALRNLRKQGFPVEFHLVGWEAFGAKSVEGEIRNFCEEIGFNDFVFFHGKKKIGQELDEMYRANSLFLNASTGTEGFPRTIWEAMANSLPVIATSVGSIPYYLTDKENALIIDPRSIGAIENAVKELVQNKNLRVNLVENAFLLAQSNTLEIQSKNLIEEIRKKQ
jgi:glycosyltransferase involved in cell wall biosynthesis